MPGMTSDAALTRDKILRAAFKEIHRNGYQAASIVNILATTGLTKGALYHHFRAKHALGLAVVDEVVRRDLERSIFQPLRDSDEPLSTLLSIIKNKKKAATTASVTLGCPLNNLMTEMSPLDPAFNSRLNATMNNWRRSVVAALELAKRQRRVKSGIDCDAAALFIISAWEGCVTLAKARHSVSTYRKCMDELCRYIVTLKR